MRKQHFLWAMLLSIVAILLSYLATLSTTTIITMPLVGYACVAFTFSIMEWFITYTEMGDD